MRGIFARVACIITETDARVYKLFLVDSISMRIDEKREFCMCDGDIVDGMPLCAVFLAVFSRRHALNALKRANEGIDI